MNTPKLHENRNVYHRINRLYRIESTFKARSCVNVEIRVQVIYKFDRLGAFTLSNWRQRFHCGRGCQNWRREGGEIEEEVVMVDEACGAATWAGAWTGVAGMISGGSWTVFGLVDRLLVEIWFDSWSSWTLKAHGSLILDPVCWNFRSENPGANVCMFNFKIAV